MRGKTEYGPSAGTLLILLVKWLSYSRHSFDGGVSIVVIRVSLLCIGKLTFAWCILIKDFVKA